MGKKRIVKKSGSTVNKGLKNRSLSRVPKKKLASGILNIHATYNNTKILLADKAGNTIMWSSAGSMGFSGSKKSTPFAAAKVGEMLGEKAKMIGLKEIDAIIKGVGPGRESALRAFVGQGFALNSVKDMTPIPFNGPRRRRPRRV